MVAVTAILLVAVVALVLALRDGSGDPRPAAAPSRSPSASADPKVPDVYRAVAPSVVVIRTRKGSLGTGVIAADDGTILTANHVIDDGSRIRLIFSDGTRSTATVSSRDPRRDVATLKPARAPQPLVPATLGGAATVGGNVVAIGNPLGLTYSVSSGVVSGLNRPAATDEGRFTGLIQFDAAVDPGSSGGPLLDAHGLVIGIVVSIADPGRDDAWAGIGFAVPIAAALGVGGQGPGSGRGPQL